MGGIQQADGADQPWREVVRPRLARFPQEFPVIAGQRIITTPLPPRLLATFRIPLDHRTLKWRSSIRRGRDVLSAWSSPSIS
jgi:hypothetical protein